MKTTVSLLKRPLLLILALLPLATFSLHATQSPTKRIKSYTVTGQKQSLRSALEKIKISLTIEEIIGIYVGFDIDLMLDQGYKIGKKGSDMIDQGGNIWNHGYNMIEKGHETCWQKKERVKGIKMMKQGRKMKVEGKKKRMEGGKIKKEGNKEILEAIRKMEKDNNDRSSEPVWEMIKQGNMFWQEAYRMLNNDLGHFVLYELSFYWKKKLYDMWHQSLLLRPAGAQDWEHYLNTTSLSPQEEIYEMMKKGEIMIAGGRDLLKKKYAIIMEGHGSNTRCHWENLARIVAYLSYNFSALREEWKFAYRLQHHCLKTNICLYR